MKILIFDFEVFRRDVLLGVYEVNGGKTIQLWGKDEIKRFYLSHKDWVWVGHNNSHYDNYVLQACVMGINPYEVSKSLIKGDKSPKLVISLEYYDTMSRHFASLKALEAYMGENISETQVDFNIDRALTEEEKKKTEEYNRADLRQTFENLKLQKSEFQLRLDLIKEFGMSLAVLHLTEARIAASVLGAKKIEGIQNAKLEPTLYENLKIKNDRVLRFYLSKNWQWNSQTEKESIEETFCGARHTIASGGIHAGETKHAPFAYYLDVSGYYNLVMINYDLLPRSIPEEGRKLYEHMYHEQLRLKKIDPVKRAVYKTILLAVFGAMNNEHCDFYDPYKGDLVRLTGEMFLVDLLEKLEGKCEIIQSNTDGIMIAPHEGVSEDDLRKITDEWQSRTGFTLKFEKIYHIVQRDVNNYMYKDENGEIHVKGEALKHWKCSKNPFESNSYDSKEPMIIAKCIVEYYMNGKSPREVVDENKTDVRLFQFICKKGTYDALEIDDGRNAKTLQNVNRIFIGKNGGVLYKRKGMSRVKYASVPSGAFVYNEALAGHEEELSEKINYAYYEERAKARIEEFREKPTQTFLF